MNCEDAQSFVSGLYDGESVPAEAAEHIRGCTSCRECLRDYAEMGAELRLLASATLQSTPPDLRLPPAWKQWGRGLMARVLVPRFALALAIFAIVGLSVGLGLVRAQGSGPWFQFDIKNSYAQGSSGFLVKAGESVIGESPLVAPDKKVAFSLSAHHVRNDLVQIAVRTRVFTPPAGSVQDLGRILANATPRQFDYVPGQTLEIPVEGAGEIALSGKVYRLRPSFWGYSVTPSSDEIRLTDAALVQDKDFLGEAKGGGQAQGKGMAVEVCFPLAGAFVFALNRFPGAVQGVAEFGQVRFKIDGHDYTLYSALPITGGAQPREIWAYKAPHCPSSSPVPYMIGAGGVEDMLEEAVPKLPDNKLRN